MEDGNLKAKELHEIFEQLIYHFQTLNTAPDEYVESLSLMETRRIDFLGQSKVCIMRQIADFLSVAVGTVTGLVDKLEEKQLVERQRSEEDRRLINLSLTSKGQEIFQFHDREFTKLCRGMLKRLMDVEQDAYIELSRKISGNARINFTENGSKE